MVSPRVVQASGAEICMKGGYFTRRGIGNPVLPPEVCTKRADVSLISGSGCR